MIYFSKYRDMVGNMRRGARYQHFLPNEKRIITTSAGLGTFLGKKNSMLLALPMKTILYLTPSFL